MKIRQAFPGLLERSGPIVRPEHSLLTVLYLLRMKNADVVPVTLMRRSSGRGIYGCSALFKATQTGPAGFANLLRGPCLTASDELSVVEADDDLQDLLDAFKLRRLGFAFVHANGDSMKGSMVSLADLLSLYSSGTIRTGMTAGDASSPIVSMKGDVHLGEALKVMYRNSYRRVFLSGQPSCIFDRQIMDHIFSPLILEGHDPEELCRTALALPLTEIEKTVPGEIGKTIGLGAAAAKLADAKGGCLVVDGEKVLTPWDAVMKPWLAGELKVA